MRTKQLEADLGPHHRKRVTHGGSLGQGKRKLIRPFDEKRPVHLVMRASCARGNLSMLRLDTELRLKALETRVARRWKVEVLQSANSGNHLHLLIKAPSRIAFQRFLKEFAGLTARLVTGAKKGNPFGQKFWDSLAFTRVVSWGRAYFHAKYYVIQNKLEALGVWSRNFRSSRRNERRQT